MLDFEKAFGEFIDCREYDEAENALFCVVRLAFKAGWLAAGGEVTQQRRVSSLERHPDSRQTDSSMKHL